MDVFSILSPPTKTGLVWINFSAPELIEAIHLLPNNKYPGEDGFPSEFDKEFKDLLVPYSMEVLDQSMADKCFPDSFLQCNNLGNIQER